ncbi:RsmB/NOP family class I SAM-dependent RNA methyltransferase [Novosphingobium sp.]|uniref:RsmB/NOP family class I SAM-dependent RNA methyltransferase n=1 Tax=Novosphingobium sp. TaxID=1874826 RepID=UPI001DD829A5|nr:RsmB/NOP family class I SAM-dependent RNA methyltransferase [Novosphingobium sp.]MBX9663814.1 RsmB/NOP family class I SAM-dependent RNA methyltransferase [Novosphingobium sp.]
MTPAARVQSAIEVLDAVIASVRREGASAERVAAEWLRARRFIGSKDRRAIRDLAWNAIRLCGEVPATGRAAMLALAKDDPVLASLFDGSRYGPAPILADEPVAAPGLAPAWLEERLVASGILRDRGAALLGRAPLDLRANRLKTTRDRLAATLPVPSTPTQARDALRLPGGTPVETWPAFAEGLFEVQDTGSQLTCSALEVVPGEAVVDLCAGAGGKTLALAAAMQGEGHLIACDIDRTRLSRLGPRAHRAGAQVETRLLNPGREMEALADWQGKADAVMIDAPCSGTGTWRRGPEARWRLTPQSLARYARMQADVLRIGAALVRPGGRLTYVVCSLLDAEGPDVVAGFLAGNSGWRAAEQQVGAGTPRGAGLRLTPWDDSTDGFFFATLHRL